MNDAGYTLSEMLAALVMIGLTVGGLTEGAHVIGLIQSSAARAVADGNAIRSAQDTLERLFDRQGPFLTDGDARFSGSPSRFNFDCGASSQCGASLAGVGSRVRLSVVEVAGGVGNLLPASITQARFVYGTTLGVNDAWPPANPARQRLEWVGLRGGPTSMPTPIAAVRLWTEQPRDCSFDPIAQNCRTVAK